jgi:hypothetical protein
MLRVPNVPTINPLFYDAISGEFRAASDPHRTHTLGRLVTATFMKGTHKNPGFSTPDFKPFAMTYKPSWAPKAEVEIYGLKKDQLNHISFVTVGLDGVGEGHDRRLSIWDCSVAADPSSNLGIRLPEADDIKDFPVELGETLEHARGTITRAVEHVFHLI